MSEQGTDQGAGGIAVVHLGAEHGDEEPPLSGAAQELLDRLVARAGRVTSDSALVGRVLAELDSPDSGAREVAALVGRDAALTARLLRLANSAAYGLTQSVTSVPFAVSVVGFTAVRTLALSCTVSWERNPPAWTELSLLHAFAAGNVAARLGAPHQDAFCAGLLADLARPLLLTETVGGYELLCESVAHPDDLPDAEAASYGLTHARAARAVFSSWNFPGPLVAAATRHHDAVDPGDDPLTVAVRAGHEVAARMQGHGARVDLAALTGGRYTDDDLETYAGPLRAQAADLAAVLS